MSEIKPILRQMIDNNKPHWRPRTIRGAHRLLDEYETKAKAFDDIVAAYENNTGLGEHDEDLTDFEAIVDSIEHGIQMVGYRENEEKRE